MDYFIFLKTCYESACEHFLTFHNLHPLLTDFLEQGKPLHAVSLMILGIGYGTFHTLIIYASIKMDVSLIQPEFEDSYRNGKELSIAIQFMF